MARRSEAGPRWSTSLAWCLCMRASALLPMLIRLGMIKVSSSAHPARFFLHSSDILETMMDPLTALSLASSIVQFVDFGIKLVGKANEIREAGSTIDNVILQSVTKDLVQINSSLVSQYSSAAKPVTSEDQVILI